MKMGLCGLLAAVAVTCSISVASDFIVPAAAAEDTGLEQAEGAPVAFILRDWEGYVGIFRPEDAAPMTVTDIELTTLRQADQALLRAGLTVSTQEELLMLLEDLNS